MHSNKNDDYLKIYINSIKESKRGILR